MTNVTFFIAVLVASSVTPFGFAQGRPFDFAQGRQYAFDARGRAARIDQSWVLEPAEGNTFDIILSVARCGDDVFLSDTQNRVSRIAVSASKTRLQLFASESQGIGRPGALVADCDRGRLHVVNTGPRTILTLDIKSGKVLATQSFKRELYEVHFATLVEPDVLAIGGLWNPDEPNPLPKRESDAFFRSTSIGQRVSLTSGTVEAGLPPYETRCVAAGSCTIASLDRVHSGNGAAWVAAHATATSVALYDAHGKRTALFDVRSPQFVRDGVELPVATPAPVYAQWQSRNSLIRYVFAFGDRILTVHTLTGLPPGWKFGEPTKQAVFMNVHALDGKPLVSDVKLPDFPVGRDDTHLYVVDYGAGGRRNGGERGTLVRIPIKADADAVQ
jgi:hypothetical protein